MAERICEVCGAKNDANARFCVVCDSYLGWDVGRSTLDGEALTGTIPRVVDTVPAEPAHVDPAATDGAAAPAATSDVWTVSGSGAVSEPNVTLPGDSANAGAAAAAAAAASAAPAAPAASGAATPSPEDEAQHRDSPGVTVATPEVVVTPDAAAEVEFTIENPTKIVDGYVFEAVDPPSWLQLVQPDVHLMPGEERGVTISIAMQQGVMVVAQRIAQTIVVRSVEDGKRNTAVRVVVTVPPQGPRLTLEARPTLIRLEDAGSGSFSVRLDNRGANYPQTVGMSGSDSEGVVRFAFAPEVVEVPAGSMVEAAVTFTAPQPTPGQQLNRQLSVSATNDEGPVVATVTLVQSTAAAPAITVQVQPRSVHLVDAHEADFEVLVDNRGGHSGITVALSGNDPERRLAFAFAPARFVAVAGHVTRAHGRLRANPPPRGTSATHPFTVIASDGTTDVEASAVLEISSSASAITTAELRVNPLKLDLGTRRNGVFGIDVDNRRGAEPLNVAFSARSDDGRVRATFVPPQLLVGPGAIGQTRMSVTSPSPPPDQVGVHRLAIEATDGSQTLDATAEITQTAPNRRRPASRWLVVIGSILVAIGALSPWFRDATPLLDLFAWIQNLPFVQFSMSMDPFMVMFAAEPPLRILLLVLAFAMAFGMTGQSGGLTRKSAILVVLLTVGFLVTLAITAFVPALSYGLPVIWLGAVLGYIGGVLARPRQ